MRNHAQRAGPPAGSKAVPRASPAAARLTACEDGGRGRAARGRQGPFNLLIPTRQPRRARGFEEPETAGRDPGSIRSETLNPSWSGTASGALRWHPGPGAPPSLGTDFCPKGLTLPPPVTEPDRALPLALRGSPLVAPSLLSSGHSRPRKAAPHLGPRPQMLPHFLLNSQTSV